VLAIVSITEGKHETSPNLFYNGVQAGIFGYFKKRKVVPVLN